MCYASSTHVGSKCHFSIRKSLPIDKNEMKIMSGNLSLNQFRQTAKLASDNHGKITEIAKIHCTPKISVVMVNGDTIRDAILTCAQQPTKVSLVYRTKPTTKVEKRSEVSVKSPGNPRSQYYTMHWMELATVSLCSCSELFTSAR